MHSAILSTERLKALVPVRPMVMLTGFLGAGKTTFLRSLLTDLNRRDMAADVILNDRENARIDRETLRDQAASVASLTGSCVCCEGLDELCKMILDASQTAQNLLLIELNGTADPLPLQETFTLLESNFLLRPRWQVCVIDPRHFGQRVHFRELEKLQLEIAIHYYISHITDLSDQIEDELCHTIKEINAYASRTSSTELADALNQAIDRNRKHSLTPTNGEDTSVPAVRSIPQIPKPHLHSRHEMAHAFTGCNIIFPEPVDPASVIPWLEGLPESVTRAKALITLKSDSSMRYLYERVGMHVSPTPIPLLIRDRVPCSGLFIGPDLQPDEILHTAQQSLHPLCHFPT